MATTTEIDRPEPALGHRPVRDAISEWRESLLPSAEPAAEVFRWLVDLRWLAIAAVALVLVGTGPVLSFLPAESATPLWGTLGALALYNIALGWVRKRASLRWLTSFASQIVIDSLALTLLVHFAGGVENPFLPLLVLHVVSANILLRPRAASLFLVVALALACFVVLGEAWGLIPHHCLRGSGACWGRPPNAWAWGTLAGLGLTLGSSSYLARYLTARLHASESQLATAVRDLSVEKELLADTQSAIELERSRLQAIIDCMGDGVTFSDPEGRLLLRNTRARELRRTPLGEGPDPTEPEALRAMFEAAASGRGAGPEPAFVRGGRTYQVTSSLVRDEEGRAMGLVTLTHDISDRLALERHLMHEERMAVVGKIAAAVAHEINNPIGVVSLYAQHALAKLPAGSPLEKHLETIRRNAESCRKITGGLLELSRPRKPERRRFDLRAVCRDVAHSVEALATERGVTVIDDHPADAAPLWTEGDESQLGQALLNLALNAVEACAPGGRVTLSARETYERGAAARLVEVSDTGHGLAEEQLAQIFQPFFTTKDAGTGLGLAVADNIVKSHSGRIRVESAVARGTTFRIHLPSGEGARA